MEEDTISSRKRLKKTEATETMDNTMQTTTQPEQFKQNSQLNALRTAILDSTILTGQTAKAVSVSSEQLYDFIQKKLDDTKKKSCTVDEETFVYIDDHSIDCTAEGIKKAKEHLKAAIWALLCFKKLSSN